MILNHCFNLRRVLLSATLIAGLGLVTYAQAQQSFLVDLNTKKVTVLGNYLPSAINESGQVAGSSYATVGDLHASVTGPNGAGITVLGTLGATSRALGINDSGQVVGDSQTDFTAGTIGAPHAFFYDPNSGAGMVDLGTLDGRFSGAYDINNAGRVVGDAGGTAFITGPNGTGMSAIESTSISTASAINDSGQVVGSFITSKGERHAYITGANGVGMKDIGPQGADWIWAYGINNSGQVVGSTSTADSASYHAFITGPNGEGIRDLGTLGGDFNVSWAKGVDDLGRVVGQSLTAAGDAEAFITGPDGKGMVALESLVDLPPGFSLLDATAINNNGQIAVVGVVPEPETYALMLAGLGLIGFMARRKKSKDGALA